MVSSLGDSDGHNGQPQFKTTKFIHVECIKQSLACNSTQEALTAVSIFIIVKIIFIGGNCMRIFHMWLGFLYNN